MQPGITGDSSSLDDQWAQQKLHINVIIAKEECLYTELIQNSTTRSTYRFTQSLSQK